MASFLRERKPVLKSVFYSVLLYGLLSHWLALIPYNSNPFGSENIDVIFSSFSRAIIPALLAILILRCRPLSKKVVLVISTFSSLILMAVTYLLNVPAVEFNSALHILLVSVGSVCIGWIYNLSGVVFTQMDRAYSISSVFFGRALTAIIVFASLFISSFVSMIAIMISLVIILPLIYMYPWDEVKEFDTQKVSKPVESKLFASDLLRALMPLFFYCVAWGAMHSIPYQIDNVLREVVIDALWILSIGVAIASGIFLWKKASPTRAIVSLFRIIVVASAFGLVLQIISPVEANNTGYVLFSASSNLMPGIWLSLAIFVSDRIRIPTYVVFAVGTPTFLIPIGIGQVIGTLLSAIPGSEYGNVFIVSCTLLLVLSAISISQMDRWLSSFTRENTKTAEVVSTSPEAKRDPFEALQEKYGLTQRELDVVTLLGKGRTYEFCAGTLCISVNTARTHVKSIYRKLGIRSREELLEILDNI